MQYKTITAVFALLASTAMAMPAAAPADAGVIEARWDWHTLYPHVKSWKAYQKEDGTWCQPYTSEYSYSYAYSYKYYESYSSNNLQARHWNWRNDYPEVDYWLPYWKNGVWCQPETEEYEYTYAYQSSYYVRRSSW